MEPKTKPHPLEGPEWEWEAAQAIILARLRANEPYSPAVVMTILGELARVSEECLRLMDENARLRRELGRAKGDGP